MIPLVIIRFLIWLVFIVATAIVLIRKVLPKIQFPVKVLIREKRGDALIMKWDRARRIKDKQGFERYQLFGSKTTIEPPKYKHYEIDSKGKPILELFSPTSNDFRPVVFDNPENLTVEDKAVRNWHVQEHNRLMEKYRKPGWLERYAPYISMLLLGI